MKAAVFSRGAGLQHMAKAGQVLQKTNRGPCWETSSIGIQERSQLGATQSTGGEKRRRARRFTVIRKSSEKKAARSG